MIARIASVGAIVLFWTALYVLVTSGGPGGATVAGSGVAEHLERLAAAGRELAAQLEALRPGDRARPARDAVVATMRERRRMERWLDADREPSEKLTNALARHRDYLDALGSLLSNPRSPLRFRLPEAAARVRAAYASLGDDRGVAATIRGHERAIAYAAWRRGQSEPG